MEEHESAALKVKVLLTWTTPVEGLIATPVSAGVTVMITGGLATVLLLYVALRNSPTVPVLVPAV